MKRLLVSFACVVSFLFGIADLAQAQNFGAVTVSACGTPNNSPVVGYTYPLTQDPTGKLCDSGGGGGGSNAAAYAAGTTPSNPVTGSVTAFLMSGGQVTNVQAGSTATNFPVYDATLLAAVNGQTPPCTGAPTGCTNVIGIIAPYQYTDISYQQVASFSTATGFTPPTGATYCVVQAETNNVRYREDGTNPTASTGLLLQVGGSLPFSGSAAQLAAIKFIPVSGNAVLDVDCLK